MIKILIKIHVLIVILHARIVLAQILQIVLSKFYFIFFTNFKKKKKDVLIKILKTQMVNVNLVIQLVLIVLETKRINVFNVMIIYT